MDLITEEWSEQDEQGHDSYETRGGNINIDNTLDMYPYTEEIDEVMELHGGNNDTIDDYFSYTEALDDI